MTLHSNGRGGPPPRIAARPDPKMWNEDELMSLPEAVALFWPQGPLTVKSLRTADQAGQLATVTIARKKLTTPAALKAMATPKAGPAAPPAPDVAPAQPRARDGPPRIPTPAEHALAMAVAAAKARAARGA